MPTKLAIHVLAHRFVPIINTQLFKDHRSLGEEFGQLDSKAVILVKAELQAHSFKVELQAIEVEPFITQPRNIRNIIVITVSCK